MSPRPALSADRVAASFERAARDYTAHAAVQMAMAQWLAEWLPGGRHGCALEVGAGPGVFTRLALPWRGSLTASDVSPAMCAVGRKLLPEVCWQVMAAEHPDAGPWDWIFSSSVLQWMDDPAAVFAAWRERLAPGGRVLSGLFAEGSLAEWGAVAGGSPPLTWRPIEEWRAAIGGAGLRLIRDDRRKEVFHYPSARAFLRSLHGAGAAPDRRLTAGSLRRMLHEYQARHQTGRGVEATWVFYRFEAELDRS